VKYTTSENSFVDGGAADPGEEGGAPALIRPAACVVHSMLG
jgi:hypothetical protein